MMVAPCQSMSSPRLSSGLSEPIACGAPRQRNARLKPTAIAASAFDDIVPAQQRQADVARFAIAATTRNAIRPAPVPRSPRHEICNRRSDRFGRVIDGTPGKVAPELRHVGIVRIQKRDGTSRACGESPAPAHIWRAQFRRCRRENSRVRVAHVGHDAPVRRSDPAQRRDFARVRHAHLDHRNLVFRLKLEQLQRQAEVVVQVALRLQHAKRVAEHRRNGFLGRGLSGAAGHRHDALAPMAAHGRSQRLQCDQRIVSHHQQRMRMSPRAADRVPCCSHHRRAAPLLERGGDKVMGIVALAADGEEEVAGRERARIDGVSRGFRWSSGRHAAVAELCCACPLRDPAQLQLHDLPSRPRAALRARPPHHRTASPACRWSASSRGPCLRAPRCRRHAPWS